MAEMANILTSFDLIKSIQSNMSGIGQIFAILPGKVDPAK